MTGLEPEYDGISERRKAFDRAFTTAIDSFIHWFVKHWLLLANTSAFLFGFLPILAPIAKANGLTLISDTIFFVYRFMCHQMPSRSFFIFGQQMSTCERNEAIYVSLFVTGMAFAAVRDRAKPLDWRLYLILITPMAIDGFTQLFGWRESTWELRLFTGTLFGAATVWLVYPLVNRAMREIEETVYRKSNEPRAPDAS